MRQAKFSVLMANYNNAGYIGEAIESVQSQAFDDWELIIVDDASQDKSVCVINDYLGDPRIKFYQNKERTHYIKSLRRLIGLAQSPILGILDSDDALTPEALNEIILAYKKNPDIGFVYTKLAYCDAALKRTGEELGKKIPEGGSNIFSPYTGAFRTFKKEIYDKTSGFDDEIFYAEDRDLIFKFEEITKLYFIDKPLYLYRRFPGTHTTDPRKGEIGKINHAIAKYKAFKRRQGTRIPNLSRRQMSSEFWFVLPSCIKIKDKDKLKFCLSRAIKLSPINLPAMIVFLGRIIKFPIYRMYKKIFNEKSFNNNS